jgi:hypothetical protein
VRYPPAMLTSLVMILACDEPVSSTAQQRLEQSVASLEARLGALEADNAALEAAHAADHAAMEAAHAADVAALEARIDTLEEVLDAHLADDADARLSALEARVEAVESGGGSLPEELARLADSVDVTEDGDVVFEGVNVYVRSGAGSTTAAPNGKGNLILGYAEAAGTEARSGSHTLVVGPWNDWTSEYGLVLGQLHTLAGAGGAVVGGTSARVSEVGAVAVGGNAPTVTHRNAVVVGGTGIASTVDCGVKASGLSSGSGC